MACEKICIRCGAAFVAKSKLAKCCDPCKYPRKLEMIAKRKRELKAKRPLPDPDYRKKNGNDNEIYTNDPPEKVRKCLSCERPKCSGDCPDMHQRKRGKNG